MTVIDEILVLFDDGAKRTLEDCAAALTGRTKQTLSSTLGRLSGKGWIKISKPRGSRVSSYSATKEGHEIVTRTLSHLRLADDESWNQRWLFIIFNIPEKQRKYRDLLRNKLIDAGFGRVQNSLWVSARDVLFEIEDVLSMRQIKNSLTILKPQLENDDAQQLAQNFECDWKSLNSNYKAFLDKTKNYLKGKSKDPLEAKLLVYHYSTILAQDPKLPHHLEPKDYLRTEAHQAYLDLRPYCYEK